MSPDGDRQSCPEDAISATAAPFVPNSTLPLASGGLFSRKVPAPAKPPPAMAPSPPPLTPPPPSPSGKPRQLAVTTSAGEPFQVCRNERTTTAPATISTVDTGSCYGLDIHSILNALSNERSAATAAAATTTATTTAAAAAAAAAAFATPAADCGRQQLWTENIARKSSQTWSATSGPTATCCAGSSAGT